MSDQTPWTPSYQPPSGSQAPAGADQPVPAQQAAASGATYGAPVQAGAPILSQVGGVPAPVTYPTGSPDAVPMENGAATSSGASAWFTGLLALAPIVIFGPIIASIVMIVLGSKQRTRGVEPARTIGARAASWAVTYLGLGLALLGAHFYVLFTAKECTFDNECGPAMIPFGALLVLLLVHVVICIFGGVWATKGKALPFYTLPFFK